MFKTVSHLLDIILWTFFISLKSLMGSKNIMASGMQWGTNPSDKNTPQKTVPNPVLKCSPPPVLKLFTRPPPTGNKSMKM